MTRKEEVYESSKEYGKGILLTEDRMMCEAAYQQGAYWADKTMIDKVCKWFSSHFYDAKYQYRDDEGGWTDIDAIIEDFRKAMEE